MFQETGKQLTRKDIDNIGKKLRNDNDANFETAVHLLEEQYGK